MRIHENMNCFFCGIQTDFSETRIAETALFFSRFDSFPVSPGHSEIILKEHKESFFALTEVEVSEMYEVILKTKESIDEKFHPDAYNIGINEGRAGGRTIDHLHIHLIPRYIGDVDNPRGGIRNVIPGKGDYVSSI